MTNVRGKIRGRISVSWQSDIRPRLGRYQIEANGQRSVVADIRTYAGRRENVKLGSGQRSVVADIHMLDAEKGPNWGVQLAGRGNEDRLLEIWIRYDGDDRLPKTAA